MGLLTIRTVLKARHVWSIVPCVISKRINIKNSLVAIHLNSFSERNKSIFLFSKSSLFTVKGWGKGQHLTLLGSLSIFLMKQ